MKYYRYLYLAESLLKKKEKIIKRLEDNRFQPGIHLVVLSDNVRNHLDIISSALLLQPGYPRQSLFVVGIAKSYEDALELVEIIAREVYDRTSGAGIRNYILEKEQEE